MIRLLSYLNLCICITGFKLLFLKSYVSTDFDVHRNWMAITYNLPIKEWYFDTTSEWTLDYPPLFAAFEFLLAIVAHLLNLETTLKLSEHGTRDLSTVIYQKGSVVVSDIVYYYAVYKLCRSLASLASASPGKNGNDAKGTKLHEGQNLIDAIGRPDRESGIALLLLLQPGLLLVDHIHFQYNGLLSGVFLLAIASIMEGKYIFGSFWFATLLNMKHIYLYCAPAFGLYLLTSHCLRRSTCGKLWEFTSCMKRTSQLGITVIAVFCITFAPFADLNTLKQIQTRLFPFKRGLTHAYWAPNIWALYNTVDKVLATVFKDSLRARFDLDTISRSKSSTSGLVQEYKHQYLPTITPLTTLLVVAALTLPLVIKFLLRAGSSSPGLFIRGVIVSSFTAFMFGWHVHEKAIIVVLLPLIPVAFRDPNLGDTLLRLTLVGTYSLFPLLFQPAEYVVKATILISYYCYARSINTKQLRDDAASKKSPQSIWRQIYFMLDTAFLLGIILVEFYSTILHGRFNYSWNPIAKLSKYEFLPLMLTSSFSALGISISYLELYLNLMNF